MTDIPYMDRLRADLWAPSAAASARSGVSAAALAGAPIAVAAAAMLAAGVPGGTSSALAIENQGRD